jgi:hypothetical protein
MTYLVPPEMVDEFLRVNTEFDADHVRHVAIESRGIIGRHFGSMLLYGTHEALRARSERQDFFAYILTFKETRSCLVEPTLVSNDMIAQEVRSLLHKYSYSRLMTIDVLLQGLETSGQTEREIRTGLKPDENERIQFVFHSSDLAM